MSSKLKKVSINILVCLFIAWILSELLKFVINIPHIEIILTIMGFVLPIVNSSDNKKKARIITAILVVAVLFYAASTYTIDKSKSIHKTSSAPQTSSKIVRSSSKITQSSSQAQAPSQAENNNAKVVINGGQDVELNDNNFNGPGQAVQTNSAKNVKLNGNNFNQ